LLDSGALLNKHHHERGRTQLSTGKK